MRSSENEVFHHQILDQEEIYQQHDRGQKNCSIDERFVQTNSPLECEMIYCYGQDHELQLAQEEEYQIDRHPA
jgi:hypothetical protein